MSELSALLQSLKTLPSEALESAACEFKEYTSAQALFNAKDLADEIVAIANGGGGRLIVGVRDSSSIEGGNWGMQLVGAPSVDLIEASARIRGKIKPHLPIVLREEEFEGRTYIEISVPAVTDSLVTTTSGKVYIRDGRSSRPMAPDEIVAKVKALSSYDWSGDVVAGEAMSYLSAEDVEEARQDFQQRRDIDGVLSRSSFLEAIGATRNGKLTRAGLLFFGTKESISHHLGLIEFRFSWKTAGGRLNANEIWSSESLWRVIGSYRRCLERCNTISTLKFRGKNYDTPLLDPSAFHEALMNAIVHRDYSAEGMVSVEYDSSEIKITSPGGFYGGVTEDNIHRHQPRHRNKVLAKLMMDFALVDRAGMGVPRMSLQSLRYGRAFPVFKENSGTVQVTMQAEHIRPGIFVVAVEPVREVSITSLVVLNSVYEVGFVKVEKVLSQLSKVVDDPWSEVQKSVRDLPYTELCATRSDVLIRVTQHYRGLFDVDRTLKASQVSKRLVKLYEYLRKHGAASNSDISAHLGYRHSSQTSDFLRKTKFVKRTGSGPQALWSLVT